MRFTLFFLLVAIVSFSCNNTGNKIKEETKTADNKIVAGKIIEDVKCSTNPKYTYSYYLPGAYDVNKSYPVIIIFDAHARAYLSISKFVDIAEKYGYILVASASSRNGSRDINDIVNSLWRDVNSNFSIDKNRMYAAGFSGGAKVAASLAIYKGGIRGVIACGAGMPLPNQEITNKFDYIGVVGLDDFNYQEMQTLESELQSKGLVSSLLTFEGEHHWPPSYILEQAVAWLNIMNMKQSAKFVDNQMIRGFAERQADSINLLFSQSKLFESYKLYSQFIKDMKGLYDISEYEGNLGKLVNDSKVKEGMKSENRIHEEEIKEQEIILSYFKSNNFSKINNKIKDLQISKRENIHFNKRLLNFMSMISYIYVNTSIESADNEEFASLIKVYESVTPNMYDSYYFRACKASMDGKQQYALQYLGKAVDSGYYDVNTLKNIGYFTELKQYPEFDIVLQKAYKNARKQ